MGWVEIGEGKMQAKQRNIIRPTSAQGGQKKKKRER